MVTVAEDLEALYPTNDYIDVPLKGYINGNWGNFNRHWHLTGSANIKPGMGLILSKGDEGENTVTEWGANAWRGHGFSGWDKGQIATITTAMASGDLCPVYPFIENPACIFQGHSADMTSAWDAQTYLKAGATGEFLRQALGASEHHTYAQTLYYVPDAGATITRVVMKEFHRVGRGSVGQVHG